MGYIVRMGVRDANVALRHPKACDYYANTIGRKRKNTGIFFFRNTAEHHIELHSGATTCNKIHILSWGKELKKIKMATCLLTAKKDQQGEQACNFLNRR